MREWKRDRDGDADGDPVPVELELTEVVERDAGNLEAGEAGGGEVERVAPEAGDGDTEIETGAATGVAGAATRTGSGDRVGVIPMEGASSVDETGIGVAGESTRMSAM